jgi:hypothetical protein
MKVGLLAVLKHWTRAWCGRKLSLKDGQVMVEYKCLVCAKRDVEPEAWERRRIEEEAR